MERVGVAEGAAVVTAPVRPLGLLVIAVFKLLGCVVLFTIAISAFLLMHTAGEAQLAQWIRLVRGDPDELYLQGLLVQLSMVAPRTLEAVSAGTAVYATLLLTEGVGLWLRQRWAEYFTVVVTASLIPFELYEVARRPSLTNLLVLGSNVVIVVYLVGRVLQRSGRHGNVSVVR